MRTNFNILCIAFLAQAPLSFTDFTLFDIQPISGFSPQCLKTYKTSITGCNMTNFFPPTHDQVPDQKLDQKPVDNCTTSCRSSLLMAQSYIRQGCAADNVQFGNHTLISHFMLRTGVDWLCGTESGIAIADLPLQVADAPPAGFPSDLPTTQSIPASVTLSGGPLPPAKLSTTASTPTTVTMSTSISISIATSKTAGAPETVYSIGNWTFVSVPVSPATPAASVSIPGASHKTTVPVATSTIDLCNGSSFSDPPDHVTGCVGGYPSDYPTHPQTTVIVATIEVGVDNSTLLSFDLPPVTPGSTNGIVFPTSDAAQTPSAAPLVTTAITDAPTLSSSMPSVVNISTLIIASSAAPTMAHSPATTTVVTNTTLSMVPASGDSTSTIPPRSTSQHSSGTLGQETGTSSATAATTSNAAVEKDKSSFALVLGLAAMVGLAA